MEKDRLDVQMLTCVEIKIWSNMDVETKQFLHCVPLLEDCMLNKVTILTTDYTHEHCNKLFL